jgi:large subunit ribosomal protein L29
MNAEDLKAKSIDELMKLIIDLRKEQFNIRFQRAQGALENTAQVRVNRRAIARAKTILNQKRLEEKAAQDNNKSATKSKKTSGKKVA